MRLNEREPGRQKRPGFLLGVSTEGRTAIEWNKKMPDGVMANISHFDCDVPGPNPGLATSKNVGFSLTGKAPYCECGEQGSSPGVSLVAAYSSMEEYCATNTEIKVRLFLSRLNIAVWCNGNTPVS